MLLLSSSSGQVSRAELSRCELDRTLMTSRPYPLPRRTILCHAASHGHACLGDGPGVGGCPHCLYDIEWRPGQPYGSPSGVGRRNPTAHPEHGAARDRGERHRCPGQSVVQRVWSVGFRAGFSRDATPHAGRQRQTHFQAPRQSDLRLVRASDQRREQRTVAGSRGFASHAGRQLPERVVRGYVPLPSLRRSGPSRSPCPAAQP